LNIQSRGFARVAIKKSPTEEEREKEGVVEREDCRYSKEWVALRKKNLKLNFSRPYPQKKEDTPFTDQGGKGVGKTRMGKGEKDGN